MKDEKKTVGRDAPEPQRSGRPCKTSKRGSDGQRTENSPGFSRGECQEGDILKVREMTGADCYEDVLMEPVQFVEGCFVCGSYVAEWTLLRRWLIDGRVIGPGRLNAEVVGNRRDNPEIMEMFAHRREEEGE